MTQACDTWILTPFICKTRGLDYLRSSPTQLVFSNLEHPIDNTRSQVLLQIRTLSSEIPEPLYVTFTQ